MIQKEVSLQIDELSIMQLIFNGYVVIFSLFFKLNLPLFPYFSSRTSKKNTSLDKLQPNLLLIFHVYTFYLNFSQFADINNLIKVFSSWKGMFWPISLHFFTFNIQIANYIRSIAFVLDCDSSIRCFELNQWNFGIILRKWLQKFCWMYE